MPFCKIDVLVNLKIQALTFYKLDGSRIRDMEAERLLKVVTDHIFCRMYGLGVMLDIARLKVHLTIQIVV